MLRQNASQQIDPFAHLNDPSDAFKNPLQLSFIRGLVDMLRRTIAEVVSTNRAVPHLLLQSPNGAVFRVTVNDDGTLTAVNARG